MIVGIQLYTMIKMCVDTLAKEMTRTLKIKINSELF